jgi:hypothetical protein
LTDIEINDDGTLKWNISKEEFFKKIRFTKEDAKKLAEKINEELRKMKEEATP